MMATLRSICPHCRRIVRPRQRCSCLPPKAAPTEKQRLERNPHRKGYTTAGYQQARKQAITRATDAAGNVHCERCGMVVGLWRDVRGRVSDYQTHHIDGNPTNNAPGNLVVLCEGRGTNRCHERTESERRGAG